MAGACWMRRTVAVLTGWARIAWMMHSLTWCARIWLWESAVCEFDGRRVGLAQFGVVEGRLLGFASVASWLQRELEVTGVLCLGGVFYKFSPSAHINVWSSSLDYRQALFKAILIVYSNASLVGNEPGLCITRASLHVRVPVK